MSKTCVTDKHIGVQMWQAAAIRELGYDVDIKSFSGHARYAGIERQSEIDGSFGDYDLFVVGFPPVFYRELLKFEKPIIVNCAHRLQIHTTDKKILDKYLEDNGRIILATMSEYDYQYIIHYLGIEPVKLNVYSFHLKDIPDYSPVKDEFLVGPANVQKVMPFTKNKFVKMPEYRLDDKSYLKLAEYPGVVVFPYSAWAVSIAELYDMNIPMFVPSKEYLIRNNYMNDVCLAPCYCKAEEMMAFDNPHRETPHAFSPNSYKYEDMIYWSQYYYVYQKKNTIIFEDEDDLYKKIESTDLKVISSRMKAENEANKKRQLKAWKKILEKYL